MQLITVWCDRNFSSVCLTRLEAVRVWIALLIRVYLAASNAIFALPKCLHQGTNLGKSMYWGYLWNCWEYISETQPQVLDSTRQGAISLADTEYLPAVPVGYMKEVIIWNLFPFHFLSVPAFFPTAQGIFSETICLAKSEVFLRILRRKAQCFDLHV